MLTLFPCMHAAWLFHAQELHITALLFGALVQHQLVTSITLGIALRYVLDALKRPPGTKMFMFGVDALRQFAPSVHLWPPFCAQALQVRVRCHWMGFGLSTCRLFVAGRALPSSGLT